MFGGEFEQKVTQVLSPEVAWRTPLPSEAKEYPLNERDSAIPLMSEEEVNGIAKLAMDSLLNPQSPRVQELLSGLGLRLYPEEARYALFYIATVADLKNIQRKREEGEVDNLELTRAVYIKRVQFHAVEEDFKTFHRRTNPGTARRLAHRLLGVPLPIKLGLSRERMMQVRKSVEETTARSGVHWTQQ